MIGVSGCGMPTKPATPTEGTNPPESTDPTTPPESGDNNGNTTPPAQTTPPPTIDAFSVNRTIAGGNLENRTVVITGHVTDSDLVSCKLLINDIDVGATCDQNAEHTGYDVNFTWVVANDADTKAASGEYTITLVAVDAVEQQTSKSATVTVDNDAPGVVVSGGGIIKSGSMSPTVVADDAHEPITYAWVASEANPSVLNFVDTDMEPTFTPKNEGTYVFYLQATDSLGNVSGSVSFNFGYKQELETIPLPTTQNPTDGLVDKSPSIPAIAPASSTPTIRNGRDELLASDDEGVLGNTVAALSRNPPVTTTATIAPTTYGWSIFGLLWYWWLVIIGVFFAGWMFIKKLLLSRVPEHS